ncbi:hypothetical protein Pmar_PMAR008305 [Perkinsus marinus ATCC 50983]|uniref:EF-hand domain-containing protein n=1 Tax=Perkinsus marinus (strain ATCC 50983 / TXsc) TaxID=423536 RepID=C5KYQ1_PERM5|nr:hypothetical protein Pmar_PMAR008305 [Perkinsus marinus ATCC 50983]EER10392.1 hypothetical protein Pmar_PMAR008305 [Perkinsus marinus ATCC 50983]|eukprot:XP_002778597.1 hypothetical protein Pmar_PMAR008305 [Perkinsus marinus ATCC 50983]
MIFSKGSGDIDWYWFFSSQAFSHLHEVFKEADKEGRGWISEEEFVRVLRIPEVAQKLKFADVSLRDAADLFSLIDINRSRKVTYTEFVEGCLRIAGQAKGKDLLRVQYTLDKKFERMGITATKKRIYWID